MWHAGCDCTWCRIGLLERSLRVWRGVCAVAVVALAAVLAWLVWGGAL